MTKPYKTHLLGRLQTTEDRVGYLRAAFEENDEATFELAIKDVCESVNFGPPPSPAVQGRADSSFDDHALTKIEKRHVIPQQAADDGSLEWCDDCHGYTHLPNCPSRQKRSLVESVVNAVYRSMRQYDDGTWFLDNLRAVARVKKLLATVPPATTAKGAWDQAIAIAQEWSDAADAKLLESNPLHGKSYWSGRQDCADGLKDVFIRTANGGKADEGES